MKRETPYPQKRQPPKMMTVKEHETLMEVKFAEKDRKIYKLQRQLKELRHRYANTLTRIQNVIAQESNTKTG